MGYCYLLKFDEPISDGHTTQFYLGFAEHDLENRLREHKRGQGARITQVACERGIGWRVTRVWERVDRTFERRLKRYHHHRLLCPETSGSAALNRMKDVS